MDNFYKHLVYIHNCEKDSDLQNPYLKCIYCTEQCSSPSLLCNHIVLNHKYGAFQCPHCCYRSGPWEAWNHLKIAHRLASDTPVLVTVDAEVKNKVKFLTVKTITQPDNIFMYVTIEKLLYKYLIFSKIFYDSI